MKNPDTDLVIAYGFGAMVLGGLIGIGIGTQQGKNETKKVQASYALLLIENNKNLEKIYTLMETERWSTMQLNLCQSNWQTLIDTLAKQIPHK